MNQDQIKDLLLQIKPTEEFFSVVFSGKSSKKVDGLYKPEEREILIHNQNMNNDNQLIYTAIHEYTHHLHFTEDPTGGVSARAHSTRFWSLFHELLRLAEEKGIYQNTFMAHQEFQDLTKKIKDDYLAKNGALMKEFGGLLVEAMQMCRKFNVSFEDYLDRELCLHRNDAKSIMRVFKADVDPALGFETMKTVARISNPENREKAQEELKQGFSPDMVKDQYLAAVPKQADPVEVLEAEKKRIIKRISSLQQKLEEIENKLNIE